MIRESLDKAKKAKKEEKLPKSSGKLVDLKKELDALRQMQESLSSGGDMTLEGEETETKVEFANLSKFAKEIDKLKQGKAALETSITNKVKELEEKIKSEKNKIREMIGLVPQGGQKVVSEEKPEEKETVEEVEELDEITDEELNEIKKKTAVKKVAPAVKKAAAKVAPAVKKPIAKVEDKKKTTVSKKTK